MSSAARASIGLALRAAAIPRRRASHPAHSRLTKTRRFKAKPGKGPTKAFKWRSFPPGAVVSGYFRDYLERFGLLFVYLRHFLFIDHVVEGQRQHDVESFFRGHGGACRWVQRARDSPFEIIQNGGNRDACRRERDCKDMRLIQASYAGAVIRHGIAPRASFTVRSFRCKRAHSSIE